MAAEIFVNSDTPLDRPQTELADAINAAYGELFEIVGGSSGQEGWNLDLRVDPPTPIHQHVTTLITFLKEWGVPADTYLDVFPEGWPELSPERTVPVYPQGKPD